MGTTAEKFQAAITARNSFPVHKYLKPFILGENGAHSPQMARVHPTVYTLKAHRYSYDLLELINETASEANKVTEEAKRLVNMGKKTIHGSRAVVRKNTALRRRHQELTDIRSLYNNLGLVEASNVLRFFSDTRDQWSYHLSPTYGNEDEEESSKAKDDSSCNNESEHVNDTKKQQPVLTEEEERMQKYFDRNEKVYDDQTSALRYFSVQVRETLDKVPKETRQWFRSNYGECCECGCIFRKHMVNMYAVFFPT
ncbi:MAG: hypothetical protein SGARI_006662, partial [Bacillariaceae sp.]